MWWSHECLFNNYSLKSAFMFEVFSVYVCVYIYVINKFQNVYKGKMSIGM